MPYDLQDPNLDFAGQSEILSRALRQAQADKLAEADAPKMMGNWVLNTGPMGGAAAAIQRGLGTYNEGRLEAEKDQLGKEQLRRYDELTRRMEQPGVKVLKKTLNALPKGQEGPIGPEVEQEVPLDLSDPNDALLDNSRRMAIASDMYKLPMARKIAEEHIAKGTAFPDTLAKLQIANIEKGNQEAARQVERARIEADRIQSREAIAAGAQANARLIASGNQAIAQGRLDDTRARAQEKADDAQRKKVDAAQSAIGALDPIQTTLDGLLTKPDSKGNRAITPELEAYTGNWDQYMPEFALKQSTVDAGKKLTALKDQITMVNLAEAKKAVGQSFGSMQVKEWDKFVNTLSSLDRAQGKEQLAESLNYVDKYIKTHKAQLQTALGAGGGAAPGTPSPVPGARETKVIGGKTYVKENGQWFEQ